MKVDMVDLKALHTRLANELDNAIMDVVRSGAYIKGPDVHKFEEELAQYLGVKYVISCGNGTDALQLALMSLNIPQGAEIITTAQSFIATAEAAALLGYKPVFVDVKDDYNIDVDKIEAAITNKTAAIIPVHLFGKPCEMGKILQLARKHKIHVIEDTAQALGAEYWIDGKMVKAGTAGTIGCTSFFPTKNLACMGDGGAVWTDNEQLARRLRMLATHGAEKKYHNTAIGINSRLDTIQAAILRVKLRYLDEFNAKRREIAKLYNEKLSDIQDKITLPRYEEEEIKHVYHQYTITLNSASKEQRDTICERLKERGVSSMVYFPVALHKLPVFSEENRYITLLNAERLMDSVISLPMHTELSEEEIEYVCQMVHEVVM
ncbi:MAG: DegT/DnrJ/EryC1/StrS family aminotransferase [Bacteroidia bacterium]|nr:DegT/DnrJ/EryC1/StrS family aminotransferase [Bacteroidia bacterium]